MRQLPGKRTRCARATLALALGVALAGCGGGSAKPELTVGFNEDPGARSFALQAKLDMPVRRFKVPWSAVEPRPGAWNFSVYDALYRELRADGLRPLLLAVGTPCWTRPGKPCYGVPDPSFDADWATYVRRLVARYPDAIGVEVWNEENAMKMFPPHPDPARYTQLLRAAYRAVKAADPRMPVISGGLLPSAATTRYATGDAGFLRAMYAAGAARSMDAIGAHPYPIATAADGQSRYDLAAMEHDLDRLRAVRDAAGHPSTPIWITEMGVSTRSAGGFPAGVTQSQQANDLVSMLRDVEEDGDVRVALIHRLVDTPLVPGGGPADRLEAGFGVFRANGTPKRAACALSDEFRGSLSC